MAIDDNTTYGLTGAQVKDLASKVNNLKTNAGAPTTATVGTVGQLLADTANGKLYICTAVTAQGTTPETYTYTWTEVGAGGGPTVVQTTGTSQTDVMSQDAVTSSIFGNANKKSIKIGYNAYSIYDGQISIGAPCTNNSTTPSTAIGYNAYVSGNYAMAIGTDNPRATGARATALGHDANALANGAVAVGSGSSAQIQGEFNIGSSNTSYGYNSTHYRLLTGVHDPQSAHDAATKGYVDGKVLQNAGAPTTATVGTVGQLLEDTTNGKLYICTDATNPYVWEEVGTGSAPVITMTSTDPGEGQPLAANNFIAVY